MISLDFPAELGDILGLGNESDLRADFSVDFWGAASGFWDEAAGIWGVTTDFWVADFWGEGAESSSSESPFP